MRLASAYAVLHAVWTAAWATGRLGIRDVPAWELCSYLGISFVLLVVLAYRFRENAVRLTDYPVKNDGFWWIYLFVPGLNWLMPLLALRETAKASGAADSEFYLAVAGWLMALGAAVAAYVLREEPGWHWFVVVACTTVVVGSAAIALRLAQLQHSLRQTVRKRQ